MKPAAKMPTPLDLVLSERDALKAECEALRAQRDDALDASQKQCKARMTAETEVAAAQKTINKLEDQVKFEEHKRGRATPICSKFGRTLLPFCA